MIRNAVVKARINDRLKYNVEKILSHMGFSMSDVINGLFNQIAARKIIPFDMEKPNRVTRKTLENSARGKNVKKFNSPEELFDDLGI